MNDTYIIQQGINPGVPLHQGRRPRGGGRFSRPMSSEWLDRVSGRMMAASGGYYGAKQRHPNVGWSPGTGSADEDLLFDLSALRGRCRDRSRNDPLAVSAVNTKVANVVGTGYTPQCRIDYESIGWSEDRAKNLEHEMERYWRACRGQLDAAGIMDFADQTSLAYRQAMDNGDVVLYRRYLRNKPSVPGRLSEKSKCGLAFEMIEADRIATPWGLSSEKNIRDGIVFDNEGRPTSYYINKRHPGDYRVIAIGQTNKWLKVNRFDSLGRPNILHIYKPTRPGQSRGAPLLAPVVLALKQLADYMEAEVVAANVAACIGLAVTAGENGSAATFRSDREDSGLSTSDRPYESVEPGMVYYFDNGQKIQPFDPSRPNSEGVAFIETFCRFIGAALDLPFELLQKNFSRTNYSSARAALLEARRHFVVDRQWLIRKWCQPVWTLLMEEAVMRNVLGISLSTFWRYLPELTRCRWQTPAWGWVDPTKEIKAWALGIENGIATRADATAETGGDWEEQTIQGAREVKLRTEKGLKCIEAAEKPKAVPQEKQDGS